MTAPPHWETTSHTVRQKTDKLKRLLLFSLFPSSLLLICPVLTFDSISVLSLGLKQLLDAQQLCDVTLLVEGKKFMCHRYRTHKEECFNQDSLML